MANVCDTISQDITSNCNMPTSGMEATAYIFSRTDISPTYDAAVKTKVTDLTIETGQTGYKIYGHKQNMNAGHDAVIDPTMPTRFTHYFSFHGYEFDSEAVQSIDSLEDLVVVVERKEKPDDADGIFIIYGLESGLATSSDTLRMNDANSVRQVELQTEEGSSEKHSQYNLVIDDVTSVYAATKALLEGLMTV
jgi:gamma-glutamylcyclotransferase (GGCT)/AIG2-like uncharacterized protein YtfP